MESVRLVEDTASKAAAPKGVGGSSPPLSAYAYGEVPERPNGAVLKTAGYRKIFRGFESLPRRLEVTRLDQEHAWKACGVAKRLCGFKSHRLRHHRETASGLKSRSGSEQT